MTLKIDGLKVKRNSHMALNLALFSKVRKYKNKYRTKICDFTAFQQNFSVEGSLSLWSFLVKLSPFSSTKIEELTAGSDEKTQHSTAGIWTRVFQTLVGRSNHWATKPRQKLRANSCLSPSCQFFFHYEVTRIARVYKHTTNENSLDLNPFNWKLALVRMFPHQIPSFFSDNDRRTESWISFVWSSCQFFYLCWRKRREFN